MAQYVGVPTDVAVWLPRLAVVVGLGAMLLARSRPDLAFQIAIVTMIAGSPLVSINWYVLLFGLIIPVTWPSRVRASRESPASSGRIGNHSSGSDDPRRRNSMKPRSGS